MWGRTAQPTAQGVSRPPHPATLTSPQDDQMTGLGGCSKGCLQAAGVLNRHQKNPLGRTWCGKSFPSWLLEQGPTCWLGPDAGPAPGRKARPRPCAAGSAVSQLQQRPQPPRPPTGNTLPAPEGSCLGRDPATAPSRTPAPRARRGLREHRVSGQVSPCTRNPGRGEGEPRKLGRTP